MSTFPIVENVAIVPVLDTNIYGSGDILFIENILTAVARADVGTVTLVSVSGFDLTNTTGVAFELWFFNSEPTEVAYAVNDPFGMGDADALLFVGHVSILATDYVGAVNNCVFTKRNIGLQMETLTGDDLYVIGVIRGTPTFGLCSFGGFSAMSWFVLRSGRRVGYGYG